MHVPAQKMAERTQLFICVFIAFISSGGSVEKIRIDPTTTLYRGSEDGRVYTFHGLDTENSSPPWYLRTLTQQQIDLTKTVRHSPSETLFYCSTLRDIYFFSHLAAPILVCEIMCVCILRSYSGG